MDIQIAVSYTHLDVYKRQIMKMMTRNPGKTMTTKSMSKSKRITMSMKIKTMVNMRTIKRSMSIKLPRIIRMQTVKKTMIMMIRINMMKTIIMNTILRKKMIIRTPSNTMTGIKKAMNQTRRITTVSYTHLNNTSYQARYPCSLFSKVC